jgi:hypothetical protein
MMHALSPTVIFVPVGGANSGWDRSRGKPPSWQRKPANSRPPAWGRSTIPSRGPIIDVDLVRRLTEQGKRHLAETKDLRAALLAA